MGAYVPPFDELNVPDKDPAFKYKWCNSRERVMRRRLDQGYEVVPPDETPAVIRQLNPSAGGDTVRTRGDLVLMRIKNDVHAERIAGPIEAAKARQKEASDDMTDAANDRIVKEMAKKGVVGKRDRMIFPTTGDPFKR
jgi:hypothetical protein